MSILRQYQVLHSIAEQEYYTMTPAEFDSIQPQLDATLGALEESLKRQDVWSAINLALLLPRFMVIDELQTILERLNALTSASKRLRARESMQAVQAHTTPDARLAAEAPAMYELLKQGLLTDIEANPAGFECLCSLCIAARAIVKRVEEGKTDE